MTFWGFVQLVGVIAVAAALGYFFVLPRMKKDGEIASLKADVQKAVDTAKSDIGKLK